MKEQIIRQFLKIRGTDLSADGNKITVRIPSENSENPGKLICIFPRVDVMITLIDIHSSRIPALIGDPVPNSQELRINFCESGRCELQLHTKECTYLTNREIAIDAGQAMNTFFFPGSVYSGVEITVYIQDDSDADVKSLFSRCKESEYLWISQSDQCLDNYFESLRLYIENGYDPDLLTLKVKELLILLRFINFSKNRNKRIYYPQSQIQIAKQVKDIIAEDLSKRHTAKELSEIFGVSDTSIKNYFRNVYGYGFLEYQQRLRMETAAEMLVSANYKIVEIAVSVGYTSQSKFGSAFKAYYGFSPLEYRRLKKTNALPTKKGAK